MVTFPTEERKPEVLNYDFEADPIDRRVLTAVEDLLFVASKRTDSRQMAALIRSLTSLLATDLIHRRRGPVERG